MKLKLNRPPARKGEEGEMGKRGGRVSAGTNINHTYLKASVSELLKMLVSGLDILAVEMGNMPRHMSRA